ncbi:RES family NAD+ phosphorylase [Mucilaginibacter sp. KACC 22063]|uniref:RES family NAD+ phosphorylase n=1 Tax=Mucilaginibacter sp. KACC 22063 TaxID=3025666 RepID=UPI0023657419|nr:RES family NAD+ phosphorylase [Mucilaginibacter sp. KACC 22063]WDF56333.1 RES family NAD+ phosphorylase [Mucilaginibacter sp. KACC 22063]
MQFSDLNKIKEVLSELNAIDLRTVELDEILSLYAQLSQHVGIITVIPQGTVVTRAVSCNYLQGKGSGIPNEISQISYNPNAASCGFNRASWEGKTAFYGSVRSEFMEPYYTCGFEALGDLKESSNEIDKETFVIGKWIVKKDLQLVQVSGNLKHNESQVMKRTETFNEMVLRYPDKIEQLKMIDNFLTSEYSRVVEKTAKYKYKLSAAYAEFIKHDNWPGLLFPSVQVDGAGTNIALFPEYVHEYLDLERAALVIYYKRSNDIVNEFGMEAFPEGERLRWAEIYKYKLPPAIRKWYNGLSDDDSFKKYISYEDL